jgi:hypothetical protein
MPPAEFPDPTFGIHNKSTGETTMVFVLDQGQSVYVDDHGKTVEGPQVVTMAGFWSGEVDGDLSGWRTTTHHLDDPMLWRILLSLARSDDAELSFGPHAVDIEAYKRWREDRDTVLN